MSAEVFQFPDKSARDWLKFVETQRPVLVGLGYSAGAIDYAFERIRPTFDMMMQETLNLTFTEDSRAAIEALHAYSNRAGSRLFILALVGFAESFDGRPV